MFLINSILRVKLQIFSYPLILTCVLGAQKNRLIETVLSSTHNMCFGLEMRFILTTYLFKHFYLGALSKYIYE